MILSIKNIKVYENDKVISEEREREKSWVMGSFWFDFRTQGIFSAQIQHIPHSDEASDTRGAVVLVKSNKSSLELLIKPQGNLLN